MQKTTDNGGRPPGPIRVVVADSHPITLEGLRRLFQNEGFEVLATCQGGRECLDAVRTHRPDVLVLDWQLQGVDGLGVLRELRRQPLATRAVLLTANPEEKQVLEAIRLGVRGVVLKEMPPHLLVQCIKKVHTGQHWVEKQSAGRLLEKLLRREMATRQLARDLTRRELDILRLVASGLRNKAIAEQLFIKEGTVKIHLHNIYKKLNVPNRLALTLLAQKKGFM